MDILLIEHLYLHHDEADTQLKKYDHIEQQNEE